jgi:hypothetical protein
LLRARALWLARESRVLFAGTVTATGFLSAHAVIPLEARGVTAVGQVLELTSRAPWR